MRKYIFFSIFIIALNFSNLFSQDTNLNSTKHKFFWNLSVGKRIESVKTADVEFYENGILTRQYEERNIIDLTTLAVAPGGGFRVMGVFKVFRREKGEEVFKLEDTYDSDFIIHTNGRYTVPSMHFMPNVRDVPTFPETEIELGDTWVASSFELIKSSVGNNITMALKPEYTFSKITVNDDGTSNAFINYNIIVDKDLVQAGLRGADYPSRIYGFNYGQYEWDMALNIPKAQTERYQIIFGYGKEHDFASLQYKMNMASDYKIYDTVTRDEEEEIKKKLVEELNDNSNIEVDTVPEGLVLRLGDILFDTNSAFIKADSRDAINEAIAAIKKYYPDREIIVEGHTDITGDKDYNQGLSERRAKAVADYMLPNLEHDKLSYKGYGSSKPVTTSTSVAERQKNRRVDIVIKLR